MVVDRTRLAPACPRGVLVFPLGGKFRIMRVQFVMLAVARVTARFARELFMESCLVARSIARGDVLSGREPQSWPIKVLHLGAIE